MATSAGGETQLTYAVRGGKGQVVTAALGVGLALCGLWGLGWLLLGAGDLTVAGYVFLLVPIGILVFGAYSLDVAFFARTCYVLGTHTFVAQRVAIFKPSRTIIARKSVLEILRQYSPPGHRAPVGSAGDWVLFLAYKDDQLGVGFASDGLQTQDEVKSYSSLLGERRDGGRRIDFPLAGMHTHDEMQWLAPLLCEWAGLPLKEVVNPAFVEADPTQLPPVSSAADK